jgi:hypothetical protein
MGVQKSHSFDPNGNMTTRKMNAIILIKEGIRRLFRSTGL